VYSFFGLQATRDKSAEGELVRNLVCRSVFIALCIPVVSFVCWRFGDSPKVATSLAQEVSDTPSAALSPKADSNPCALPDHLSSSLEETGWRLFIAATCPVNRDQYPYVVWENWIEQTQMYPADPAKVLKVPNAVASAAAVEHVVHASQLALALDPSLAVTIPGLLGAPDYNCNHAKAPPADQPNLRICEEVRMNGSTADYIAGTRLWNRYGQAHAARHMVDIEFPSSSVEVKADWIDLASINMDCAHLPPDFSKTVHVEKIQGNCFALAGVHVISKLLDNWVWATFEPQNFTTNPSRCKEIGCSDSFGSYPASSKGKPTHITRRLECLMDEAHLAPEWRNYRMNSVQTRFTENGKPTLAGNSIIEYENVGLPLTQSSCITCHALSSVKSDGTDGITLLNGGPVGLPEPLPSKQWIFRDFVWSLLLACPNPGSNACSHN
jgi:hypothetical protein